MASEKMRGFGGLRSFCYLQLLGDNETGRNPAQFHAQKPLQIMREKKSEFNNSTQEL
jgi:hypothetical protein